MVSLAERRETICHFYGFPDGMYRLRYPAPGRPRLARRVLELLEGAGLAAGSDPSRGLDHGAWVPLSLMYPDADIPVMQLSVQSGLEPAHHLAVGRALRPLRGEGVLIMGSGSATHNLMEIRQENADGPPLDFVKDFAEWLARAVTDGREDDLLRYAETGPNALRNHPTPEHFLPLFGPLGSRKLTAPGRALYQGYTFGALSMAAFAWD